MILVDTSIWSLCLRRNPKDLNPTEQKLVVELLSVIGSGEAALIGPIRQELLSGIRRIKDFRKLQAQLATFPLLEIEAADYDQAATFFNTCRTRGIVATPIDLLICAGAARFDAAIFTSDSDFQQFAKWLPIKLHSVV